MSGTRIGGLKARDKNIAKDPDFYRKLGKIGGVRGTTGGYASNKIGKDGLTGPERSKISGKLGGTISRRKKKL
jgi:general stress protein YciG